MKKTKRSISLILTIAMFITAFAFTGSTVYAASGISSLPVTIKSYPISTGNNTPAYSYQGASSKSGTIYAADYCTINNIYSNGYIRVTYPTSGNKTRTLYVYSKDFFNATTYRKASIKCYSSAYRRSSGSATIGSVDSADKLVYVIGNAVNNRYQISYSVTGTNYYKLGWVPTSVVQFTNPDYNANRAVEYARAHAYDTPTYSGGDCANFVSHCLAAGGISIPNSNYYPAGTTYLSGITRTSPRNPYINAPAQLKYLSERYTVIKKPTSASQFSAGDIAYSTSTDGVKDGHAVIISKVENGYVYYCGHTKAQRDQKASPSYFNFLVKMDG